MTIKQTKLNKILFLVALFALLLIPVSYLSAQQTNSDLVLTWEPQNFYPSNYTGKASVTRGTPILISASGILNNQIIDLSNAEFTWNVDGDFYKREVGASEIVLESTKNAGGRHFVRVTAIQDNLVLKGGITIPVNEPKSVIEKRSTSNTIESGSQITLQSTPYFFNVDSINDLSFYWEINNVLQNNRTRSLDITPSTSDLLEGSNIIKTIIGNSEDELESSRSTIQLNYEG